MKTLRFVSMMVLAAVLAAGCSSGGDGGPMSPPPPQGPSESEPNDFDADTLGTLSTTDFVVSGITASASDVDMFSMVASEAVPALLVSLDWSGSADLELAVSNADGIFIRHVDTAGHPEACTLGPLPAGTYTVRVGSFTNAATSYSLRIGKR